MTTQSAPTMEDQWTTIRTIQTHIIIEYVITPESLTQSIYILTSKFLLPAKPPEIYTLAGLIRTMVWAKHAPAYESVFPETARKKEMTDEQMYAQVCALNKLFGGNTEEA